MHSQSLSCEPYMELFGPKVEFLLVLIALLTYFIVRKKPRPKVKS